MKKHRIYSCIFCLIVIISVLPLAYCGKTNEQEEIESVILPTEIPSLPEENTTVPEETEEETTKSLKSNEEIIEDVLNGLYGNGQERWDRLTEEGYDADLIQSMINELFPAGAQGEAIDYIEPQYYPSPEGALNPYVGVVYYNGHKETYYSQRVLPGDGLNIPGRHVAGDGTIRDGEGYICVAADWNYLPYGSLVETSLGAGKVYDTGCEYGTIDIYTDW